MFDMDAESADRFAPLMARLAHVAVELNKEGTVVAAHGAVAGLLGATDAEVQGQLFAGFIREQDQPLWDLITHRVGDNHKVGPVPLRLLRLDGTESQVEIIAVPGGEGHIQLAMNPHDGQVGAAFAEPRPLQEKEGPGVTPAHFMMLARRLAEYGRSIGTGATEALFSVAGLNMKKASDDKKAAKALWALHKLLDDTVREVEASIPQENLSPAPKTASVAPANDASNNDFEVSKKNDEKPKDGGLSAVTSQLRRTKGPDHGTAGCLTVAGWDGLSESDIVRAAGYAMRKTTAKHRHHSLDKLAGTVEQQVEEAKAQLKRFRQMVVQEQFDVAAQPILNLRTGAVHHYEALVRFDERFFKGSPFEMIRFAEEIGMIQDFDSAMTMKVISLIRRLRRIGLDANLAVNLSGRSIQSPVFLRNLFRILNDSDDVRKKLSFEITESSRIGNLNAVNATIQRIRRLGHKVALDDFGAGASGLQYLQRLDVDMVKIDRQYVVRAAENEDDRAFLKSIVDMAGTRGIETVGEGVDSEMARDMLYELGVTYAQGYLFGRPGPVNEVLKRSIAA